MDLKSRIIAGLRGLPSNSKLNALCDQLDKRAKELENRNPNLAHTAVFALCCKIVRMKYALDKTPLKKGELGRVAHMLADKIMDHAHTVKAASRRGA